MPSPLFFRYSYIINGSGSIHGRWHTLTVHGLFFGFWHSKAKRRQIIKDKVQEWWKSLAPQWWSHEEIEEDEEEELVPSSEAKGLGFYIGEILVDDKRVQTFHLRHRHWLRDIFTSIVESVTRFRD